MFQRMLELGHDYATRGKLKDAELMYRAVAEGADDSLASSGLDSLNHILDLQSEAEPNPSWQFIKDTVTPIFHGFVGFVLILVFYGVVVIILRPIGKYRGRNKIQVISLGQKDGPGEQFGAIVSDLIEKKRYALTGIGTIAPSPSQVQNPAKVIHYMEPTTGKVLGLTESALGSGWAKALSLVKAHLNIPEYSFDGTLIIVEKQVSFMARLIKRKRILGTWNWNFDVSDFFEKQRDLAWQVLQKVEEDKKWKP